MINAASRTMASALAQLKRMESQVQATLDRIEKPPATPQARESLRAAEKAKNSLETAVHETSAGLVQSSFDIKA